MTDEAPRFKQALEEMHNLRLSGERATTYEQLITIARDLGKTFNEMNAYLGLNQGSYEAWVATAPREQSPQPPI